MTGVVTGGWGFVIAAYGLTTIFLGGYTISVIMRYRAEMARSERDEKRMNEVNK